MVSRACNKRFLKSYSIRPKFSTFEHFRACAASDEIVSSDAQPAMKSFPRMLSQEWNTFRVCSAYFEMGCDFLLCWACAKICYSLAEHARNWLLVGWACSKIGYSLVEHARKLVTRWLSMRENWLLVGWACAEIGYSMAENWFLASWASEKIISAHNMRFGSFSSLPHVTHSSVPFSRPCLTSFVPSLYFVSQPRSSVLCLSSLSPVLCPLSRGSAPCLPSSVPSLTALFILSRPLYPVYQLSQCPLYCGSIPVVLSFAPLFPVLCFFFSCPLPLAFHICENASFFLIYIHTLDGKLRAGTVL